MLRPCSHARVRTWHADSATTGTRDADGRDGYFGEYLSAIIMDARERCNDRCNMQHSHMNLPPLPRPELRPVQYKHPACPAAALTATPAAPRRAVTCDADLDFTCGAFMIGASIAPFLEGRDCRISLLRWKTYLFGLKGSTTAPPSGAAASQRPPIPYFSRPPSPPGVVRPRSHSRSPALSHYSHTHT